MCRVRRERKPRALLPPGYSYLVASVYENMALLINIYLSTNRKYVLTITMFMGRPSRMREYELLGGRPTV
jgi:hypothetical protein